MNDAVYIRDPDVPCDGKHCGAFAYIARVIVDRGVEDTSTMLDFCYQCDARFRKDPRLVIEDEGILADISAMEMANEDAFVCGNCGYANCDCCQGCGETDCYGRCAHTY